MDEERRSPNSDTGVSDSDGPEFSSDPMHAAYGIYYSAGFGLLIIALAAAIFW